jgi:hypothetical protein
MRSLMHSMQQHAKLQLRLHTIHIQSRFKHAATLTKGVLPVPVARRQPASRNIIVRAEQQQKATVLPATFASLGLAQDIATALDTLQITKPTEIQVGAPLCTRVIRSTLTRQDAGSRSASCASGGRLPDGVAHWLRKDAGVSSPPGGRDTLLLSSSAVPCTPHQPVSPPVQYLCISVQAPVFCARSTATPRTFA